MARGSGALLHRVVVVQRILPHYRVAFFDALHEDLANRGIQLAVLYGQHAPNTVPQTVGLDRKWATFRRNRHVSLFGRTLVWQSAMTSTREANLVIVEHAARLLGNYPLLARRALGGQRVAYWGHGANRQATNPDSFAERLKRRLIGGVDWWFAYTRSTVGVLIRAGFPQDRVTVVQNAIDDSDFREALGSVTASQIDEERRRLGIVGQQTVLYCGGMYPDKRLDFLLSACLRLRERIPDVEVIFVGSGPDQDMVEAACARHRWMHFVGPVFGASRARYFAMCRALLMPGPVGLAVVDSFVAGVPLFTTNIHTHGPEIDYLEHGVNGVMTECSVEDYVDSVAHFLASENDMARLREGCLKSASIYTLGNMVRNFADGVEACLAAEKR